MVVCSLVNNTYVVLNCPLHTVFAQSEAAASICFILKHRRVQFETGHHSREASVSLNICLLDIVGGSLSATYGIIIHTYKSS